MEERNLKEAKNVFKTLCQTFDDLNLQYMSDEEKMIAYFSVNGDDLPISFEFKMNPVLHLIVLYSHIDIKIPEQSYDSFAVAISCANNGLPDGNFDFDDQTGTLLFRITLNYDNSLLGREALNHIVMGCYHLVEKYNDIFFMLTKTNYTTEEIIKLFK